MQKLKAKEPEDAVEQGQGVEENVEQGQGGEENVEQTNGANLEKMEED